VEGQGVAVDAIKEIEHNLEVLTMDIHNITMDELLRCYQCHIVGVLASVGRLLHCVAREVVFYHEQHP